MTTMKQTRLDVPSLRRPAAINAAEYWLAPQRFMNRCETLGDRFTVPMPGTGAWLCLTHPDDVKRIFTADTDVMRFGAALAKGSPHVLVLGPTGMTNLDGAAHARKRRMQNPPFHAGVLANYEATVQRTTENALSGWPYGRPAPSLPLMRSIALDVIIATVFGLTDPARAQRLRDATVALLHEGESRRFLVQTMIACSRPGGWDRPFPRMRAAIAAVDAVVLDELAERRAASDQERTDVLAMLMNARDDHGLPLSDAELCDDMRTLLLGAHDTTASTLSWVLERISRHPDVLAAIQRAALDGDDDYIDAVIKETMRLRPVFPLTARLAAEDFELPGLTIPTGTMVIPFITLLNRRPDLYDEPLAFRPERFLNANPGTYSWIPFGGGRRRCLGAGFAQMEARTVLRTLLRAATVVPTTRRAERVVRSTVTIVPSRGGRVTLRRRTVPTTASGALATANRPRVTA